MWGRLACQPDRALIHAVGSPGLKFRRLGSQASCGWPHPASTEELERISALLGFAVHCLRDSVLFFSRPPDPPKRVTSGRSTHALIRLAPAAVVEWESIAALVGD